MWWRCPFFYNWCKLLFLWPHIHVGGLEVFKYWENSIIRRNWVFFNHYMNAPVTSLRKWISLWQSLLHTYALIHTYLVFVSTLFLCCISSLLCLSNPFLILQMFVFWISSALSFICIVLPLIWPMCTVMFVFLIISVFITTCNGCENTPYCISNNFMKSVLEGRGTECHITAFVLGIGYAVVILIYCLWFGWWHKFWSSHRKQETLGHLIA